MESLESRKTLAGVWIQGHRVVLSTRLGDGVRQGSECKESESLQQKSEVC